MTTTLNNCPAYVATRKGKRKYEFTPEMDDLVRAAYHQFRVYGNRKAITHCAQRLEMPRWAVLRRGRDLGVARTKE